MKGQHCCRGGELQAQQSRRTLKKPHRLRIRWGEIWLGCWNATTRRRKDTTSCVLTVNSTPHPVGVSLSSTANQTRQGHSLVKNQCCSPVKWAETRDRIHQLSASPVLKGNLYGVRRAEYCARGRAKGYMPQAGRPTYRGKGWSYA